MVLGILHYRGRVAGAQRQYYRVNSTWVPDIYNSWYRYKIRALEVISYEIIRLRSIWLNLVTLGYMRFKATQAVVNRMGFKGDFKVDN